MIHSIYEIVEYFWDLTILLKVLNLSKVPKVAKVLKFTSSAFVVAFHIHNKWDEAK